MKEKKYFPKNFQKYDKKKINKFPKFQKKKNQKNQKICQILTFLQELTVMCNRFGDNIYRNFLRIFWLYICIKSIKLASVDFPPQGFKTWGLKFGVNFKDLLSFRFA